MDTLHTSKRSKIDLDIDLISEEDFFKPASTILETEKKADFTENESLFTILIHYLMVPDVMHNLLQLFYRFESSREVPQNQEGLESTTLGTGYYINVNRWNLTWKDYKDLKTCSETLSSLARLNKRSNQNGQLRALTVRHTSRVKSSLELAIKSSFVVAKIYHLLQQYKFKNLLSTIRYYKMEDGKGDKIVKDSDKKVYVVDVEAFDSLRGQAEEKMAQVPTKLKIFKDNLLVLQDYYHNLLTWKNTFFQYLIQYYNNDYDKTSSTRPANFL